MSSDYRVIVLGAGASHPYGMPTGLSLRKKILGPEGKAAIDRICDRVSDCRDKANAFLAEYARSPGTTIDEFLQSNAQFQNIGKQIIVRLLLPIELKHIGAGIDVHDWMEFLVGHFRERENDLTSGRYKFITFNYDRLWYITLYNHFRYSRKRKHDEVVDLLKAVPIRHVYGHFDYTISSVLKSAPSSVDDEWLDVNCRDVASGINLMHEERNGKDLYEELRTWVQGAGLVLFLGFGYNLTNLKTIGACGMKNNKILGTAKDVGKSNLNLIRRELTGGNSSNLVIDEGGFNCLQFLKEIAICDLMS